MNTHAIAYCKLCVNKAVARSHLRIAVVLAIFLCAGSRSFGLGADAMQSMVIVEGDEGYGSAFVVKMEGKVYLVTNSHVIRGNKNVKFKTLNNQEMITGPLQIADKMDLVRAEIIQADQSLTLLLKVEQHLKIGDEILVAGNSEGEGVVREIPGKVVGIGPDRIEVDAPFVPGNSGSPILVKSTGQVIGVATYMKIPRSVRSGSKSATSLNEVRRFGYRLDTVGKWVTPPTPDRIMTEGLKLAQLEETINVTFSIVTAGTSRLASYGAAAFVSKDRAAANPSLATLATSIDEFADKSRTAKRLEERKQNFLKLFEKLKAAVSDDIRGFKEENFTGYFAVLFKGHLERRKALCERLEMISSEASKNSWIVESTPIVVTRESPPPVDVSKLNFTLAEYINSAEPPDRRHHVYYPFKTKPANLENVFWVIEKGKAAKSIFEMHQSSCLVPTSKNGTYRVYLEYRTAGLTKCVSNVVEIKVTDVGEIRENKPDDPTKPVTSRAEVASNQQFNGTDPWSGDIMLLANSIDAFSVGPVKKGTKIFLQYLSGKWKAHGRFADRSPDTIDPAFDEQDRTIVALPSASGKPGDILATVPGGTSKEPFVFKAEKDFARLVLRIYGQRKFASNPGKVEYKIKILPPSK